MVAEMGGADLHAAHGLFSVLVRELAAPADRATVAGDALVVRLVSGPVLRVRLTRASVAPRMSGAVERRYATPSGHRWRSVGFDDLLRLVGAELAAATGHVNDEFPAEVEASRHTLDVILQKRPTTPRHPVAGFAGTYVDSEQALLVGHPRHPTPKWRSGGDTEWQPWAPELRTSFRLHWLAAPAELVEEHVAGGDFDHHAAVVDLLGSGAAQLRDGDRAVPLHPWQLQILRSDPHTGPLLDAAFERGALRDLGRVGRVFHPTASLRTLYQPDADVFLKTSLDVRITNCVRSHTAPELAGAVAMTRLLDDLAPGLRTEFAGFAVMREPASRSVQLDGADGAGSRRVVGALGSICRSGLRPWVRTGEQVHLVGTVVSEHRDPAGTATRLVDLAPPGGDRIPWSVDWWEAYVRLLVPPVLRYWVQHGVILEPHLQNVLVVVGADGLPTRLLVRDMEGTKLVHDRWGGALREVPPDVAAVLGYAEHAGRARVVYCLFVNNLVEVAAALADLVTSAGGDGQRCERELWGVLRDLLVAADRQLGGASGIRALLADTHLPAKANLLVRWRSRADREATYVPVPNPLRQVGVG